MATYAIVHGAGDVGASWDLVAERLRARGHAVVAPDLPCEDDGAGFGDYADTVADAVEAAWRERDAAGDGRRGRAGAAGAGGATGAGRSGPDQLVVVAHSLGGFTAPRLCARLPIDLFVLVSAMVPLPGESGSEWWEATGHDAAFAAARAAGGWGADDRSVFLHDVPEPLVAQASAFARDQSSTPMDEPFPLPAWPEVPTRFLLCRDDRFFPADWMRAIVRARLGIEPDEIGGGHAVYLSRPGQLAARLEAYRAELAAPPRLV
ncbi:alpha/beta fold hydrolase [Conexibacter arvalis]|uniref:Pimeloyl-ACP methyl ester carboxylesterase n=1 Tax=Conexibacter arvalis TaxID=912552 RepID=A0A840ICW7_9ACTN|nr:alpha/beta hydrolase [Conexibacter arvalis]MBB4662787.1 pimeloyl-ACP methyl ester carboxylesterase [Conexibacter arvalis]